MNNANFKHTILIVEDNEINRDILSSFLCDKYNLIVTENGQEGWDALNSGEEISCILLDIQMPVMNGFEFLKLFKNEDRFSSIPVIVTTSDKNEEERCLIEGASDFVKKPYVPNIILRRVEALIRLSESITALQNTEYDLITGLYNRNYFIYYCNSLLSSIKSKYELMVFSVEDFSFLISSYGYEDSKKLLAYLGNKLRSISNNKLMISSLSDGQFGVFYSADDYHFVDLVNEIEKLIDENCPIKNIRLNFGVMHEITKGHDIIKDLNRLNNTIKSIEHNFQTNKAEFSESMLDKEERIRLIEENMEKSLKNGDFKVYFQPKHSPFDNSLKGSEALIRWIHPVYGFISPGDFIPQFEENGFITQLDKFVFEKTCEVLRDFIDKGMKVVPVSINLSRRDLVVIDSADYFNEVVKKYNIDKKLIHFEITESMCGDNDTTLKKAKMIQDAGFEIEIDDFGSGYSSLGMIAEIPMNYLKLDISFAKNLSKQKEVSRSIISLAHALNVKTVAEGVETIEQLETYKELNCDFIQGYFYSKPLNYDEYMNYLKSHL